MGYGTMHEFRDRPDIVPGEKPTPTDTNGLRNARRAVRGRVVPRRVEHPPRGLGHAVGLTARSGDAPTVSHTSRPPTSEGVARATPLKR